MATVRYSSSRPPNSELYLSRSLLYSLYRLVVLVVLLWLCWTRLDMDPVLCAVSLHAQPMPYGMPICRARSATALQQPSVRVNTEYTPHTQCTSSKRDLETTCCNVRHCEHRSHTRCILACRSHWPIRSACGSPHPHCTRWRTTQAATHAPPCIACTV